MQTESETSTDTGTGTIYRSAALAVALTWALRLIGLVSALVLARLLSPRDFGIIAIAAAVVALVDMLGALGLRQALLRIAQPERAHLDTAWTIQVVSMTLLGGVLLVLAAPVGAFFARPELPPVIALLSLSFVFYGLENVGVVEFDRSFQFGRDLRMRLTVRLLGLAGTVTAALLLRSYWALAIGMVLTAALHAAASYLFHPYRPRLSLAKRSELLVVSGWMFLAYAMQVVQHQSERLILGRVASPSMLGFYAFSKDLASIFTMELATALNRVTFVSTARREGALDTAPERPALLLGAYAMIAAPFGLGLAAVAEPALAVLFGHQWLGAAPFLRLIAPASACYAVHALVISTLQAGGLARGAALLSSGGAVTMAGGLAAAGAAGQDAPALAAVALAVNVALLLVGALVLARIARARLVPLLAAIARPFAAAAAMYALVGMASPVSGSAAIDLVASAALGAFAYPLFTLAIWGVLGRPAGAERAVLDQVQRFARSSRGT